jgi:hypothetical protein
VSHLIQKHIEEWAVNDYMWGETSIPAEAVKPQMAWPQIAVKH